MIKIKLNPLDNKFKEFDYKEGENVQELIERISESLKISPDILNEHASVFIGGEELDKDFFKHVRPKEATDVVISIVPKGGDFGQTFKQVALIVIAAAITYFSAGTATPFATALIGSAVFVGASLALNALIPPPNKSMSSGAGVSPQATSQSYNISGQSNSVKKYDVVPRVYGTHRLFPAVAANPYIQIEVDENGNQSQYLYAIYDFGIGPAHVTDLKLGATAIEDFSEVEYQFVDFNKPSVNEGVWDEVTGNSLLFYKGDVEILPQAFGLNNDGTQAIATGSLNPNDYEQEIDLFFNFPSGLISYRSNGGNADQTVEFRVEFAEEGTDDWKSISDPSHVYDATIDTNPLRVIWPQHPRSIVHINQPMTQAFVSTYAPNGSDLYNWWYENGPSFQRRIVTRGFGFAGANGLISFNKSAPIGQLVFANGKLLGEVISHAPIAGFPYRYFISLANTIPVTYDYTYGTGGQDEFDPLVTHYYYNDSLNNNNGGPRFGSTPLTAKFLIGGATGNDIFRVTARTTSPYFASVKVKPISRKQLKFRVTRIRAYGAGLYQTVDNCTWSSIQTRHDTSPIKTKNRHTFLELRIKATDQLSGSISNLSGVVSSVLDVWDGIEWKKEISANPAWVVADLLTGEINKKSMSKSKLDVASLLEWANYCDEVPVSHDIDNPYDFPRFQSNFVLDYSITAREMIEQVSSAASATLNLYNGNYGVLIDKFKSVPVQLITNRNSRDFSSSRTYVEEPEGLAIKFIDPSRDWAQNTVNVYKDGLDYSTASNLEEFDTFACTNVEQAFRFGRFLQAQVKLRQETITLTMDFEHLISTRGDLVLFQQDVMKMGGQPVRIKSVSGNRITINDSFVDTGADYGYTVRQEDGTITTDTMTIISSSEADVDGVIPQAGELLVWGEVDKITTEWIVKTISPSDDLSAVISLVEYNEGIYTSESDEFLVDYDPELTDSLDSEAGQPNLVTDLTVVSNDWDCNGSSYIYFIDLTWIAPNDVYETFEVYVSIDGGGYELYTIGNKTSARYDVSEVNLTLNHDFKVLAVAANGAKRPLGEAPVVSAVPLGKTTYPSNVTDLYLNVTIETMQFDWDLLPDCDIQDYIIRYTPLGIDEARWDKSSPLLQVDAKTSSGFAQARTGTYLIKARDWNGRESLEPAMALTSIPSLVNLNAIDVIEDPTFDGTRDRVDFFADTLILRDKVAVLPSEYETEGYYYFKNFLDLTEIGTVRLHAELIAGGFNKDDVMVSWVTLDSVASLTSATGADYQVDLEYRARDSFNVIEEWATLASVADMAGGETGDWINWRRFTTSDFTGRVFQFRTRLRSFKPDISPQVFSAKVIADMVDRIEKGQNITCPVNGLSVVYDPAFSGPTSPNVQITQDAALSGDRYEITNKTIEGFDIEFFNGASSVERQFDFQTLGYGRKALVTL